MADNHSFNTAFAKTYGIEEAIIFNDLYHWCIHNKQNGKNCFTSENEPEETRKPRYWTFNSVEAFAEHYDYINKSKIYRVLKNLEEKGLILSDEFNKLKFDRTKWYTVTEKGQAEYIRCCSTVQECLFQNESPILQNEKSEFSKMKNESFQNETTIPTSITTTEPISNTTSINDLTNKLNEANSVIEQLQKKINEADASSSKKKVKRTKKVEYQPLLNSDFYSEVFKEYKKSFFGLHNGGIPNAKNYKQATDAAITRMRELGLTDNEICDKIIEAIRNAPSLDYWRNTAKGSFAYIVSEVGMNHLTGKSCSSSNKTSAISQLGGYAGNEYDTIF